MRIPGLNTAGLLLAGMLLLPMLAACDRNDGPDNQTIPDKSEGHNTYKEFGLSRYDPPIELSFVREMSGFETLIKDFPGETLEDNRWSRLYEEVLGIRIKYDWTAKGDLYHQKLGAALAAGDLPDVVRVNAQQLRQLSNAGLIQDLSDVYEEYAAPFTKEVLGQEGTGPFEAATVDGKLTGIPETNASIEKAHMDSNRLAQSARIAAAANDERPACILLMHGYFCILIPRYSMHR